MTQPRHRSRRWGALVSTEMLFVVPIVFALVVALVEFGFLWSASHKVHLAAQAACRVGTRPCSNLLLLDKSVREAAKTALIDKRLAANHRLVFRPGEHTGDPVTVELRVPMGAASPDMLAIVGFSLRNRYLTSRVVMSKE